jgi:hypothetical protein
MIAAGGIALELGLLAAGVVVVLATMWIASRSRAPKAPSTTAATTPAPATRRIAGPERRLTRAPVVRPVVVRRPTGERRTFALDLSAGGVLVAGPSDLAVGDLIELQLDLDGPLRTRAQVVRDAPNGMKGLRFDGLADADRDRLERFVRSASAQPA